MGETSLKKLFLEALHTSQSAKFGEFAGYNMPILYGEGIVQEHLHTRNSASIFDVSHMGQILVEGTEAAHFLSLVLPIPAEKLKVGRARYTVMLNEKGGIIDDLIVSRRSEQQYWIVLNAACFEKDLAHLNTYVQSFEAHITILDTRVLCAVQGPIAENVLCQLFSDDSTRIRELSFMSATSVVYNSDEVWLNRSGYTGEDGFELSIPHGSAEELVRDLLSFDGVKFAGLGARNSLRLEAGLSLYGNDMDEHTNIYEADLSFAVSKLRLENNQDNFIGAQSTRSIAVEDIQKKRVGILPIGKAILREHVAIKKSDVLESDTIGEVCSGGFSPILNRPIAFAYIKNEYAHVGTKVFAELRGKLVEVEIASLPFVAHNYKKK